MDYSLEKRLNYYESAINKIWTSSVKYLGLFSVKLLMERVVFDVSYEYREIELLRWDDDGVSCAEILANLQKNPNLPIDDMFMRFITKYVEILSRLIGRESAEKLLEKVKEEVEDNSFSTNNK